MNIFLKNSPLARWKDERNMRRMLWDVRPDYTYRAIMILLIAAVVFFAGLAVAVAKADENIPKMATAVVTVREGSYLNIREGADIEYKECGRLYNGTYVRVLEKHKGWALVGYTDSQRPLGWVNMKYLKPRW